MRILVPLFLVLILSAPAGALTLTDITEDVCDAVVTTPAPGSILCGEFLMRQDFTEPRDSQVAVDGWNDEVLWDHELDLDPDWPIDLAGFAVASAMSTIAILPAGADPQTDTVRWLDLGSLAAPGRNGYVFWESELITVDWLALFGAEAVLGALIADAGRPTLRWNDDAIVVSALLEVELVELAEPPAGVLTILGLLVVLSVRRGLR